MPQLPQRPRLVGPAVLLNLLTLALRAQDYAGWLLSATIVLAIVVSAVALVQEIQRARLPR